MIIGMDRASPASIMALAAAMTSGLGLRKGVKVLMIRLGSPKRSSKASTRVRNDSIRKGSGGFRVLRLDRKTV